MGNSTHGFGFFAQHDTNLSQASQFNVGGGMERALGPLGTLGLESQPSLEMTDMYLAELGLL